MSLGIENNQGRHTGWGKQQTRPDRNLTDQTLVFGKAVHTRRAVCILRTGKGTSYLHVLEECGVLWRRKEDV